MDDDTVKNESCPRCESANFFTPRHLFTLLITTDTQGLECWSCGFKWLVIGHSNSELSTAFVVRGLKDPNV